MFFVAGHAGSIAITQMSKQLKLHAALAVQYRQVFTCNIDTNLFQDFTLRSVFRGLPVFQTAGDRLPKIRVIPSLKHQHPAGVAGVDDAQYRLRTLRTHQLFSESVSGFTSFAASFFATTAIPSSSKDAGLAKLGASVIKQAAAVVFGKAITSRMLSVPVSSITRRSRPKARPACGGVPYFRASSRKPNFSRCSCSLIPRMPKTVCCMSLR